MLTETATAVGWRVVHDIGDSVCVEAVDGIEQIDLELGPGISPKR